MTGVFVRVLCEDTHREEGCVTKEVRIGVMQPQAKDCWSLSEAWKKLPLSRVSLPPSITQAQAPDAVPHGWNFLIPTLAGSWPPETVVGFVYLPFQKPQAVKWALLGQEHEKS